MTALILRKNCAADRQRLIEFVTDLSPNKIWRVDVKRQTARRSLSQNGLYWKWVEALCEFSGHTKDEIHDCLRASFLPTREIELGDETHHVKPSTTALSTAEFAQYMDKIEGWAASELGLVLMRPEDRFIDAA